MCRGSLPHEDSLAGRERREGGEEGNERGRGGETFLRDPATYFIYDPQEVLQFVLQMIPRKSAAPAEHKSEPSHPPPSLPPVGGVGCGQAGGVFRSCGRGGGPPEAEGSDAHRVHACVSCPLCPQHPRSSPRSPPTRSECRGAWRRLSARPLGVPSPSSTGTRRARRSTPSVSRWLSQCTTDNHKCMKGKVERIRFNSNINVGFRIKCTFKDRYKSSGHTDALYFWFNAES